MGLSKSEIKIIHKACELLETGKETNSCLALAEACNQSRMDWSIMAQYALFYKQKSFCFWSPSPDDTAHRILLLLLFAEAEEYV